MEYYGSCLSPLEQEFYNKIIYTLRERLLFAKADRIMEKSSLGKCISAVQYDYPELFYVDFSNYQYVVYNDGLEYRPRYLYEKNEASRKQTKIRTVIQKLKLDMKKRGLSSVYQKCGYIHAYLVNNCTYDYSAMDDYDKRKTAYTIEGPILENTGVCQGIALAYRLICMKCGIEAIAVRGVSLMPGSTTFEGHAWNMVRVGQKAAHIDATWDMCLTIEDWPIRYDYFFLPDIEMMRDHQYVGYPICRKMEMSYFERNRSQFHDLKELGVYIDEKVHGIKLKKLPGKYFFQFKMVGGKVSVEEVKSFLFESIVRYAGGGCSYEMNINNQQSVFFIKIIISVC